MELQGEEDKIENYVPNPECTAPCAIIAKVDDGVLKVLLSEDEPALKASGDKLKAQKAKFRALQNDFCPAPTKKGGKKPAKGKGKKNGGKGGNGNNGANGGNGAAGGNRLLR